MTRGVLTLAVVLALAVAAGSVAAAPSVEIEQGRTSADIGESLSATITIDASGEIGSESRINTYIAGELVQSMIPEQGEQTEEVWIEEDDGVPRGTNEMNVTVTLERGYSTSKTWTVTVGSAAGDDPTATDTATATTEGSAGPSGGGGIVAAEDDGAPGPLGWPAYAAGAVVAGGAAYGRWRS